MYTLAAQAGGGLSLGVLLVVYALIFGGFYFIFIRPQSSSVITRTAVYRCRKRPYLRLRKLQQSKMIGDGVKFILPRPQLFLNMFFDR